MNCYQAVTFTDNGIQKSPNVGCSQSLPTLGTTTSGESPVNTMFRQEQLTVTNRNEYAVVSVSCYVVTVHNISRFAATTTIGVNIHFAFQMGLIDGHVAY
jgi:hypothetical protein